MRGVDEVLTDLVHIAVLQLIRIPGRLISIHDEDQHFLLRLIAIAVPLKTVLRELLQSRADKDLVQTIVAKGQL